MQSARSQKVTRKGDAALLGDKTAVNFLEAEAYLGISARQRERLMKSNVLEVTGQGSNRKITTDSLRRYLPPKKPDMKRHDPT